MDPGTVSGLNVGLAWPLGFLDCTGLRNLFPPSAQPWSVGTTSQAYLRVPIGVGIAIVFLGETLTSTMLIGLLCVIVGVAAMTIPPRREAQRAS